MQVFTRDGTIELEASVSKKLFDAFPPPPNRYVSPIPCVGDG